MPDANEETLEYVDRADATMTYSLPVICPVCQERVTVRTTRKAYVYLKSLLAYDSNNHYLITCDHHSLSDVFNQLHKRS